MKRTILNAILKELEVELVRQQGANAQSNRGAMHSAPTAEKQRDTSGLEAAYLAHGYAKQCTTLAKQIEELQSLEVEDFIGQEIDVGALVEVEMNGEPISTCCCTAGEDAMSLLTAALSPSSPPSLHSAKLSWEILRLELSPSAPVWKGSFWMYSDARNV